MIEVYDMFVIETKNLIENEAKLDIIMPKQLNPVSTFIRMQNSF